MSHRAELAVLQQRFGLSIGDDSTAEFVAERRAVGRRVIVEIGFGLGDATAEIAAEQPDVDVLAIDVHTPGVLRLMRLLDVIGLANVRVVEGDALEILDRLPSNSLGGIRAFFPDPWPKHSHRHRRLIAPSNVALFVDRLCTGGTIHVATDIASYADEAERVMTAHPGLIVQRLAERPSWRAMTKFERQGIAANRQITDVVATRTEV